jgi:hypothetical protein
MQFNLPLHNNLEVRRRQRTNPRRIITMNNPKLKTHHLLRKETTAEAEIPMSYLW